MENMDEECTDLEMETENMESQKTSSKKKAKASVKNKGRGRGKGLRKKNTKKQKVTKNKSANASSNVESVDTTEAAGKKQETAEKSAIETEERNTDEECTEIEMEMENMESTEKTLSKNEAKASVKNKGKGKGQRKKSTNKQTVTKNKGANVSVNVDSVDTTHSTDKKQKFAVTKQETAVTKQETAEKKQQTADKKQETADNKQETADNKQETAEKKQGTAEKSGTGTKESAKRKSIEEDSVTTVDAEEYLTRFEHPECSKRVKYPEDIKSFIDNIKNSITPPKPVLNDEYSKPLPLIKFYVGQVKSVQDISQIVLILNQKQPLKNLGHLKRVFRKEILLFPASCVENDTHVAMKYYIEENFNQLRNAFEYFRLIDIPTVAPKIKKQYEEVRGTWSFNFHPDSRLEKLYSDELFTDKQIAQHRLYMSMAFEVFVFYMKKKKRSYEPYDIMCSDLNATVIVDPSVNSVVAASFDNRGRNPLQHSAMIAIDNVAKTQKGGAWKKFDIANVNLRGIGYRELLVHLKQKFPKSRFGAREFMTKSDLEANELCAAAFPYLCTNYNVYMIREPCIMCAMALVHARSKRVFFCMKNPMGALTTLTKLHCIESLNHRYEVFTYFM